MGSNVELDIGADISDERHCKNQEVRNSTNCGLKKTRQRKKISPYSSNVSGIQHCTNATGEPLDQDRLKSSKGTELFSSSNKNYDTSASEKRLKGTLISAV